MTIDSTLRASALFLTLAVCACHPVNNTDDAGTPPADTGTTSQLPPDAASVAPDAATIAPDAATVAPDAATIAPDAATIAPDAATIDPDAGTIPPDAGMPRTITFTQITATPSLIGAAQPVKISFTASEKVTVATLKVGGRSAGTADLSANPTISFTFTTDSTLDMEGDQSLELSATSGSDAMGTQQLTGVLKFDFTPPTGTSFMLDGTTVGTGRWFGSGALTGTAAATDPNGPVRISVFEKSGMVGAFTALGSGKVAYSYSGADGQVTLCARFQDALGNTTQTDLCDSVGVDTTPPTAPTLIANAVGRTAQLSWSGAQDGTGAGIATYKVHYGTTSAFGGAQAIEGASPVDTKGQTSATLSGLSFNASFQVAVSAVDGLGHEGPKSTIATLATKAPYSWVFPSYGPGDAVTIDCKDASSCWMLTADNGNRNGLVRTLDGGQSFQLLDTGSAAQAYVVRMRDQNVGLLGLKESGKVRRTSDGGLTWSVIPFPKAGNVNLEYVEDIRWIPGRPTDVLMVVHDTTYSRLHLLSSTDAGLTFTDQGAINNISSAQGAALGVLAIADPTAGAEKLVMSFWSDIFEAGALAGPWTGVGTGYAFRDLAIRSPKNGIAVGASSAGAYSYLDANGNGWATGNAASCSGKTYSFTHASAPPVPSSTFWVASSGYLCKSTDGGLTLIDAGSGYTKRPVNLTYNTINALTFVDDSIGYLQTNDVGVPTLLKTTNGGAGWTLLQNSLLRDAVDASPIFQASFWVDEKTGFVGEQGVNNNYLASFYRTADGGSTWSRMTMCNTQMKRFFFKDKLDGISWGDLNACHTGDGGLSWTSIVPNPAPAGAKWVPHAADYVPGGLYFLAGVAPQGQSALGYAATSADGISWTQLSTVSLNLMSIAMGTPTSGAYAVYAGDANGTLWRIPSTSITGPFSGGWFARTSSLPAGWANAVSLDTITFPAHGKVGYIASSSRRDVLKTTDGGDTWKAANVDSTGTPYPTVGVRSLSCEDETHCVFISNGEIWVTNDGFASSHSVSTNASGLMFNPVQVQAQPGVHFATKQAQIIKTTTRWE